MPIPFGREAGGFEIDLAWNNGKLTESKIKSLAGQPAQIRSAIAISVGGKSGKEIELSTEAGKTYTVVPA